MGLKVHSLKGFPKEAQRDYYVYLLDYGWKEPLGNALRENFDKFATLSSKQDNSVVVMQTEEGVEFNDEVLSWHGINGDEDPDLLPAVLITNRHPSVFREYSNGRAAKPHDNLKLILFPLRKYCRDTADVIALVRSIFKQIADGKAIENFKVTQRKKAGHDGALVDSIIVEPTTVNIKLPLADLVSFLHSGSYKSNVQKTVMPIHFEDRSGTEFERLAFAFLLRHKDWHKIHWLGQTGKDGGRDIWADLSGNSYCYACANYQKLTIKKGKEDIDKLVKHKTIPAFYTMICGGTVSAATRKIIIEYAMSKLGVKDADVWSGAEFEERLYKDTPQVLQRFVNGEPFPDTYEGLRAFTAELTATTDETIMSLIAECFDRPAFTTPFHNEVNIPDFGKAITDTIEVLNTGMHRLRDGTLIRQIPSRFAVKDAELKKELADITNDVIILRDSFNSLVKNGDIRPCGCGEVSCSIYMMSNRACEAMDEARDAILEKVRQLKPDFAPRIRRR